MTRSVAKSVVGVAIKLEGNSVGRLGSAAVEFKLTTHNQSDVPIHQPGLNKLVESVANDVQPTSPS